MAVKRRTAGVLAGCGALAVLVFLGVQLAGAPAGVTADPAETDISRDDAAALDEYAEELGLVMVRSRGPAPQEYARRVDGPGPDVQTLALSGSAHSGGAEVVLRLRLERAKSSFLGEPRPYEVSACYRWVLGVSVDDHEPQRLDACPGGPAIQLGPPPVEPRLPDGLAERLEADLTRLAATDQVSGVTVGAVAAQARATYRTVAAADVARPGVDAAHLLTVEDALSDEAFAVADGSRVVTVAVGRGEECVMAEVRPGQVRVWTPARISLQPGEAGCVPHAG